MIYSKYESILEDQLRESLHEKMSEDPNSTQPGPAFTTTGRPGKIFMTTATYFDSISPPLILHPTKTIYLLASTIEEAKYVLINHANMPDFYLMEDECIEETLKAGIHRDIRIRWIRYVEDLYGLAFNPDKDLICYSPKNKYLTELATAFKSTHNITSMSFLRSNMEDFKKSDDPVLQEIAKAIEKEIGVDRQNIPPVEWTT